MSAYIFFTIVAIIGIAAVILSSIAKRHISDSEAEEGCDACRWLHKRMDSEPCRDCEYGGEWERQDE